MSEENTPNPVDVHVGKRLRFLRKHLGMSQNALAAKGGVTFQQIQKYENGTNRISASMMWAFANALGITIADLFEGLPRDGEQRSVDQQAALNYVNSVRGFKLINLSMRMTPEMQDAHIALMELALS